MNRYFVELLVTVCGYEKVAHHVVFAENEEQAMMEAIAAEHHNDVDDDGEQTVWYDDIFTYEVNRTQMVQPEHIQALDTYLNFLR